MVEPIGRITTPFGFHSEASEVINGVDLTGKRAIVTGGASGIGIETARALAGAGAEVTIAVRNTEAAQPVAAELRRIGTVSVESLDLTDLKSVRAFVKKWEGPLHILVNNAGVMASPEQYTENGWELQFATNHLGHFALALGLYPALKEAVSARIVAVSSSAHMRSPVIFDDLHFRFRLYDPWLAYGQAKTANILFAVEATNRWSRDGIFANSLMPGAIPTNLQRHTGGIKTREEMRKTPEEGASTSVLLAASPLLEGAGGKYFVNCNEAEVVSARTDDLTGVAPFALEPANAKRLWDVSLDLVEG
jgi:NAD(P)-dependent dehydrogenase (short-subunit alcohol dehydrogenase family)